MNMSYCRFENTFNALRDCKNALEDDAIHSASEVKFAKYLIEMCRDISAFFDGDDLDDVIEETCDICNQRVDEEGKCGCDNDSE
jgi:hypothetical protein